LFLSGKVKEARSSFLKKRSKKLLRLRICTIVPQWSNPRRQIEKSSLVLSFKKEHSSFPSPA
jgi:hypothetical protein